MEDVVYFNIEALKNDLEDYYGSAISFNSIAMMDLVNLDNLNAEELINLALKNNFDLDNYVNKQKKM